MSVASTPAGPPVNRRTVAVGQSIVVRSVLIAGLLGFVLFALPNLVGADWITTFPSVAIYSTGQGTARQELERICATAPLSVPLSAPLMIHTLVELPP